MIAKGFPVKIKATERPPAGRRFAPGTFDNAVGRSVSVRIGAGQGIGMITSAIPAPDGLSVEIEVEVPGDLAMRPDLLNL
jgi:hypothetical protein